MHPIHRHLGIYQRKYSLTLLLIALMAILTGTNCHTQAATATPNTNEQSSTTAGNVFNSLVELNKTYHLKQIPIWEIIDAIANSPLIEQGSVIGQALELATMLKIPAVAHGLAKKCIRLLGTNCPIESFLDYISLFSEKAQIILRKEFFLMTGNPLVMTYTDKNGTPQTLTFVYEELFYERQYLIDNAKLIFNNRFLSTLDGFVAPIIYYVDKADLSNNFLTTLPDSLATVPTINYLDLSHNQLATVPEVVSKLPALEFLYLRHNHLTTLAPSLGNLKHLYRLDISYNQLQTLPIELVGCTNLHWLNCSHNAIKQLPAAIVALQELERLDLSDNQLSSIPAQLAHLPSLWHLNIKNNPSLRKVPATFKRIARLEKDDYVVFEAV